MLRPPAHVVDDPPKSSTQPVPKVLNSATLQKGFVMHATQQS
jgi:hypothetical protein